ncbi:MAG: hypothetical protein IPP14_15450 [Planctomycetes bacterium]|nr:hypothetical protein [Planctomycetota bacterium]
MHKFALMACTAALALGFAVNNVHADPVAEAAKAQSGDKLPKLAELKINDGTDEGFKAPADVVTKAIKAAKESKMADLKLCLNGDARNRADEKSWSSSEGNTNLKELQTVLATFSEEGMQTLKQGTVGNYAVVLANSPMGAHLIRVVREQIELEAKEGEEAKKLPYNWYLSSYSSDDYQINLNAPNFKEIIEAINKGDVTKMKEFLEPYETQGLELLVGMKEGVDPYDLLIQRLKKIITNGQGKPTVLLNRYSSEVAFWFNSEAGDTFIVLNFWTETTDWKTKKKQTVARIGFSRTAEFHKKAGPAFKGWVNDYDWGN